METKITRTKEFQIKLVTANCQTRPNDSVSRFKFKFSHYLLESGINTHGGKLSKKGNFQNET